MSNTLKIGELVAPPVENTLADAKTVPLPGIPAAPAPPPAAEPTPPLPEAPALASESAAPPEEQRPGPSAELREFIAMLRRDRKNLVQLRRLKRTAWAVAVAATAVYFVHRSGADSPQPAAPAEPPPIAFESPPEPEPGPQPEPDIPAPAAPGGQLENAAGCQESFSRQRWRAAVDTCTKVFEESPGPEVALRIAHAHWARGQADQAGVWARKALRLGNRDADAFVLIGHAAREAGHGNRAAAAYRRYLQSSPRGWHAKRLRAAIREIKRKTAYRQPSALRSDHVIR